MEVEIKIKIDKPEDLQKTILSLGGEKIAEGLMHDVYYDDGKGFFKAGNTLRIRTGLGKALLTNKQGPIDHNKHVLSRPEFETFIEEPDHMHKILENIGFKPLVAKDKKFINYNFQGDIIEFHELPFLGHFIEIEAVEEKLKDILPKLGLTLEMGLNKGYNRLFDEYKKEKGLPFEVQDTFADAQKFL